MTKAEWAEKIISRGFRELAKECHPDKGGDQEKFKELVEAAGFLRSVKDHPFPVASGTPTPRGYQLQLEMAHISTLLTGRPLSWVGPGGTVIDLILRGVPGNLVAEVLTKLVEKYVKPRKR